MGNSFPSLASNYFSEKKIRMIILLNYRFFGKSKCNNVCALQTKRTIHIFIFFNKGNGKRQIQAVHFGLNVKELYCCLHQQIKIRHLLFFFQQELFYCRQFLRYVKIQCWCRFINILGDRFFKIFVLHSF